MRNRMVAPVIVPVVMITIASLVPAPVAGQGAATRESNSRPTARKSAARPQASPRTPWGDSDLQGVWDYRTITFLERPAAFGDKEFLTDEEAAEVERQKAEFETADPKDIKD